MSDSYDTGTKIPGKRQTYATSADASGTALDITNTGVHEGPSADVRVRLWDLILSADTDMSLTFRDEDGGNAFMLIYLSANTPVQITPRCGVDCPVNGLGVEVLTSAAGNIAITSKYSYVSDKE